jgi:hypothetical protein
MNKSHSHAFVNQLLVYALVMICFTGSVGLGTVWLRHQISLAADRCKKIEAGIAELDRHLAETRAAIETEEGPDILKKRNIEWQLGLVPPTEAQVAERVGQDPGLRLVAKNNRGLFADRELTPVVLHLPGNR